MMLKPDGTYYWYFSEVAPWLTPTYWLSEGDWNVEEGNPTKITLVQVCKEPEFQH